MVARRSPLPGLGTAAVTCPWMGFPIYGRPHWPNPHIHILPCPSDTRPWRTASSYSRGEGGGDAGGGPLWSPVRCLHPSPSLNGIAPCGRPSNVHSTPISLFEMYYPPVASLHFFCYVLDKSALYRSVECGFIQHVRLYSYGLVTLTSR